MYQFVAYSNENATEWDRFIDEQSCNGTFLQSRRFFSYHPEGRFQDASILIYNQKHNLVALCPGCTIEKEGKKTFFSHKGSTFGGLILDKRFYAAKYLFPMIAELEEYLKGQGYDDCYLKMTSAIFSQASDALFQYAFVYQGFQEYKELSTYVDLQNYSGDVISHLAQGKRTNVHHNEAQGAVMRTLDTDEEIGEFYQILCENLRKYDTAPVHTLAELLDFKNSRFQKECEFLGIFLEKEMIAGGMMFYFHNSSTAHTQYLAQKDAYTKLSPMSYLYYSIIVEMKKRGYQKVSWGIVTEDLGKYINTGLVTSKEDYGSTYCNNMTYYKSFSDLVED